MIGKLGLCLKNSVDSDVYSFIERNIREKVLHIERYEIFVVCVDILNFLNEREEILCSVFVQKYVGLGENLDIWDGHKIWQVVSL